jgi:hypothetical protein
MIRNYLIRASRKHWVIRFHCIHNCSKNNCKKTCKKENTIQTTSIKINSFDKNTAECSKGFLVNADETVIPDRFFEVVIFFPLSTVFSVSFHGSGSFTRKNILHSIKILYNYIYQEEERTATAQDFKLKKICSSCHLTKLDDYIKENNDISNECSICCDTSVTEKFVMLDCKHTFHTNCIKTWSETSATCPICRYNIFMCTKCNGSGIIYYGFTGITIPVNQRNNSLRNHSNGIFGIHSYDFEDLSIEEMIYNNVDKKLYLNVTGN